MGKCFARLLDPIPSRRMLKRPTSEVHRARSKKTSALVALKKIIMHNEKDGVGAPYKELPRHARLSDDISVPDYGP